MLESFVSILWIFAASFLCNPVKYFCSMFWDQAHKLHPDLEFSCDMDPDNALLSLKKNEKQLKKKNHSIYHDLTLITLSLVKIIFVRPFPVFWALHAKCRKTMERWNLDNVLGDS